MGVETINVEDTVATSSAGLAARQPRPSKLGLDISPEDVMKKGKTKEAEKLRRSKSSRDLGGDGSKAGSDVGSMCGGGSFSEDAKAVAGHIAKMNITQILAGSKLGVSIHHASEAARKMEPRHSLQLRNHIKMARIAEAVQPSKLESIADSELDESLSALTDFGVEWPVGLQAALWRKQVKQLVNAVRNEPSTECLSRLLESCRSYTISKEEGATGLNIKELRLRKLPLPEAQKKPVVVGHCGWRLSSPHASRRPA